MNRGNNKVVVCDDDKGILEMLEMIVQSSGVPVKTQDDSSKLLKQLEVEVPKLLIIDLWMPNFPGDAIIRKLRSDSHFKDLYILCISASLNGEQIAMEAGANQFLSKPFDINQILSVLDRVVLSN
ncbi:response regulator [Sphingobacterium deserti]|uniref:Response regulator receiver protein n=1 Tax=Sphingobacterium deserti TaxID=1229276 RepID=A0A0B8T3W7_9SPHI|nr:response regulator [Sphingobacterium deserti]KGE15951.1 response regulator receiver protein [Sphingobacterium deserti]